MQRTSQSHIWALDMNIISYSFYRAQASEYEQESAGASRGNYFRAYIRAIVRAHHSVFPEWKMRFYHDDRVREFQEFELLTRYQGAGLVELRSMGPAPSLTGAMLWRLMPAFDPEVETFLCRDIDSLPQPRERVAVERWLASEKPISALHDSTSHWGTVILGGMCGFRAEHVRKRFDSFAALRDAMAQSGIDFNRKGGDQLFLNRVFDESDCLNEWVDPEAGPWDRDRNFTEGWARCVGGGFTAEKVAIWYDRQKYTSEKILECEQCE